MVDGAGTTTYSYDGAGQLLSEAGPWSGVSVSNTYSNRLRRSMSVQAPGAAAWTNGYYYDSARRLTGVTSAAGSFGYQFAPGVQDVPSGITLPNGASIADSYDSVARLTSTTLKNSQSASLALHQYGYNLAGQRTNQARLHGDHVTYTYDSAGELKTAQGRESGGSPSRLQEQLGYAYDAAGNLTSRTNNALLEMFSVNAANELTTSVPSGTLTVAGGASPAATNVTISGSASGAATLYADGTWALPGAALPNGSANYIAAAQWAGGQQATGSVSVYLPPSASYTYDPNGNLMIDGNRGFDYDDEHQLISVWVTDVWRTDFAYDGKMRLRARVEYAWNGSGWLPNSTVYYVYDGNLVVQEQDQNNTPKVSYTRGRDMSGTIQGAGGIGGLLARTDNSLGTSAYYFADGNGNITCMLDGNQAVAASYLYDPYGRILSQSGWLASANLYRFSSKEFQINSGLVYYGYRFYDPNLQRWLNRDPIGEDGGANLFAYAGNAPSVAYDPDGHFVMLACCIGCAAFIGWDIYNAYKRTCAGKTGSDWANCMLKSLISQLASQAGVGPLASCLYSAVIAPSPGGATADAKACFKKYGLKALGTIGKDIACGCCVPYLTTFLGNKVRPPVPAPPVPAPAVAPQQTPAPVASAGAVGVLPPPVPAPRWSPPAAQ